MVQYSEEILNLFGGPELSKLDACGASELPEIPNYLDAAMWHFITGLNNPDSAAQHLEITFLRQSIAASNAYKTAHNQLLNYIEGLKLGQHRIYSYLSAVTYFEYCIGSIWRAVELWSKFESRVLKTKFGGVNVFEPEDGTDLERINLINGALKHFSAEQAVTSSAPMWITNCGLSCAGAHVEFNEIRENISALWEICRISFAEIPSLALAKQRAKPESDV
jgi:hypothetical protein